eukprot:c12768_g1_i1.p1 GENE.c12768_g1_i1~~c12768_g1_i1.p1  ORF type:complete len:241 (+),score=73.11 c12768_g1_i1:1-723(+)
MGVHSRIMSVIWHGVFGVLAFEVFVLVVLLLPIPSQYKRSLVEWVSTSAIVNNSRTVRILFLGFCLALFGESIWTVRKVDTVNHHHLHHLDPTQFRAHRNLYLTFFVMFLGFVIDRVAALIIAQARAEKSLEVIRKQAEQNNKAYQKVVEEKEQLERDKPEAQQAKKEASQIIRQAENQQESFVKLVEDLTEMREKNKSLKAEIARQKRELDQVRTDRDTLKSVVDDYDDLRDFQSKKSE